MKRGNYDFEPSGGDFDFIGECDSQKLVRISKREKQRRHCERIRTKYHRVERMDSDGSVSLAYRGKRY